MKPAFLDVNQDKATQKAQWPPEGRESLNPQIQSSLHSLRGVKVNHGFSSCLTFDPPPEDRGFKIRQSARIPRRGRRLPTDGRRCYCLLSHKRRAQRAKPRSMMHSPAGLLPPRCCATLPPSRCGRRAHSPYIAAVRVPSAAEKTAPKLQNR